MYLESGICRPERRCRKRWVCHLKPRIVSRLSTSPGPVLSLSMGADDNNFSRAVRIDQVSIGLES